MAWGIAAVLIVAIVSAAALVKTWLPHRAAQARAMRRELHLHKQFVDRLQTTAVTHLDVDPAWVIVLDEIRTFQRNINSQKGNT